MKLAICDDCPNDLQLIEQLISEHFDSCVPELFTFDAAQQLFQFHSKTPFDLVILDIKMPEPNGFEIAKKLKKITPNILIIFVTQSMAYTVAGYGIAFRYVPKCNLNELLIPSITKAIEELDITYYELENDGNLSRIPTKEIIYIEVYNHNIILHTLHKQYCFRDSISNVYSQLPQKSFGIPHQSYIVNFEFISKLTPNEVCLTSNVKIPISRRRSQIFNQAFHRYLRR